MKQTAVKLVAHHSQKIVVFLKKVLLFNMCEYFFVLTAFVYFHYCFFYRVVYFFYLVFCVTGIQTHVQRPRLRSWVMDVSRPWIFFTKIQTSIFSDLSRCPSTVVLIMSSPLDQRVPVLVTQPKIVIYASKSKLRPLKRGQKVNIDVGKFGPFR